NTGTNFSFWTSTVPATTTILASNLAAAIARTSTPSVPVTATSSAGTVTVQAIDPALGAPGNAITLSQTGMSGFSWANGGAMSGGVNGSDTGTSFSISNNTTTEATHLTNAINRTGNDSSV